MIGTGELILIFCVILMLFGGKRLPELAKSLGQGIREFKKACNGLDEETYEKSDSRKNEKPIVIEAESNKKENSSIHEG